MNLSEGVHETGDTAMKDIHLRLAQIFQGLSCLVPGSQELLLCIFKGLLGPAIHPSGPGIFITGIQCLLRPHKTCRHSNTAKNEWNRHNKPPYNLIMSSLFIKSSNSSIFLKETFPPSRRVI